MNEIPLPAEPYIPGQTERHPEGWFDALKEDGATALRAGRAYFEAGYFWECHEVLEAVWLETDNPSAERDMVQAVIQLANACLKRKMLREKAAQRLFAITSELLDRVPDGARPLGFDPTEWRRTLETLR